ncbi:MAG: alpha/beta hydrolase [Pseudomonadota bacterium]
MTLTHIRAGAGLPFVMVHGYLAGAGIWRDQIDHFRTSHDVIAVDLPGFGQSVDVQAFDSIEVIARHVLSFLTDIGVENFILMGHSMGGMVVQKMAALEPERVSKLICYGTGPVGVMPGRFETIDESRARIKSDGVPATAARIAATWYLEGENGPGFDLCKALGEKVSEETALACLTAWEGWDGRADLARIMTETLIICGDSDRSYNWSQTEALWRGIKSASLAVIPGCSHNAHLEKPHLFNAALDDFVKRH